MEMILPKEKKPAKEINFNPRIPYIVMDCGRRRISCHCYMLSWILAFFNFSIVITFGVQIFTIGIWNFYPDETAKYFLFAIAVLLFTLGLILKIRLLIIPLLGVYITITGLLWLFAGCLFVHSFFPSIFTYIYYNSQYHKFKYFLNSYEERVVSFVFSLCLATILMTISVFFIGSLHIMRKVYNNMGRKENARPTYIPQDPVDFFDDERPVDV